MGDVTMLHGANKKLEELDRRISDVIRAQPSSNPLSPAEVAGVFKCIEFRMFMGVFDD